jgi:hypothetical protein
MKNAKYSHYSFLEENTESRKARSACAGAEANRAFAHFKW